MWRLLFALWLPFVAADPAQPVKGLAGGASAGQMTEVYATWRHGWALCPSSAGPECVDVSKGMWTWEDPPNGYGQGPDEIEAAMLACKSGWFMVGDEWVYQGKPLLEQVEELHWYLDKRNEVNPDCRIAFGGILTYHPYVIPPKRIAVNWVPAFHDAYVSRYGEPPGVQALVLDDYYWANWHDAEGMTQEEITIEAHGAIREAYGPGVEIWAREVGSLISHATALEAMESLADVAQHYDRYAWFISRSSGSWDYTALWVDSELTDLGEMYWEFECR